MAFGMEDMRAFAREWLEELVRVGYYGMEESLGLPLKQQSGEFFSPAGSRPIYGRVPARVGEIGQVVWLKLDGPRSPERGYREISVSDEPLRTDAAILAALSALEGRPIDVGALRKVLAKILPLRGESFFERWTKALEDRRTREGLRPILQDLRHHQTLDYALMLLRYHSPGFDEMVLEERVDLIEETCSHINEFVEVLHKLMTFLEHGKPKRRGPAATKVAARDIKGCRSQGGRRSHKPSDRTGAVHQYSLRLPDQGGSSYRAQDGQTWQERPGSRPRRRWLASAGPSDER